jgi:hypothetical protein
MNSNNDRLNNALTSTNSRRQALKLMGGGLVGGLAMATGLKGVAAHGHKTLPVGDGDWWMEPGSFVAPLNGVYEGEVSLVPRNFFIDRGQLALAGDVVQGETVVDTFTAAVHRDSMYVAAADNKLASVSTGRTSDVSRAQQTCEILNLTIGPIYLDLLGLVVEVPNEIVLNIRAESGQGNLLGNLLCAVAGLLDGPQNALGRLRNLLNQILGALGL